MNKQEHNQLSEIHRHVYGHSAVIAVALNALEYQNSRGEDLETAHIELVLQNLHYDLAAQCEKLEEMLEAAQAKFQADAQAEQVRKEKEWLDSRLATITHEAAEAFAAVNAAYGIQPEEKSV